MLLLQWVSMCKYNSSIIIIYRLIVVDLSNWVRMLDHYLTLVMDHTMMTKCMSIVAFKTQIARDTDQEGQSIMALVTYHHI